MRVVGSLYWMHVLTTATLTWVGVHLNRGKNAFEAFGILTGFLGTLEHDGWRPNRDLACQHGLCNAHHLREMTYVFDEMGQVWDKCLHDLLLETSHEVTTAGGPLSQERITHIHNLFAEILAEGNAANPRVPPSGKWSRTKQSKAANLLDRLRILTDDVLRFMADHAVSLSPTISPNRR